MSAPARTPPPLPGLQPDWSRVVFIEEASSGSSIGVHVLDSALVGNEQAADLTVLCVHGNPTWSYLWREVIAQAPNDVRVVAIDQVGMGFSARTGRMRRLEERIEDLQAIVDALDITGRIVVLAHDWGGPVALGWASAYAAPEGRLAGVVLTNTAVHQPDHSAAPRLIALARSGVLRENVCARTTTFLRGTTAISSVDRSTARAFRAPYGSATLRAPIADFVADIPLEEDHPSMPALRRVADGLPELAGIPTLLVWGMRDPVFSARYLDDLRRRLPHADVQQYADAGHLVLEDRPDAIADIWGWIADRCHGGDFGDGAIADAKTDTNTDAQAPLHPASRLYERANSASDRNAPAITTRSVDGGSVDGGRADGWQKVSWSLLGDRARELAVGFRRQGIAPGDRVAVLVPPSADLLAVVYGLWQLGATVVVIDAAHKPPAMIRALRGARLDHIVAIRRATPIVAAVRVPGVVIWRDRLAQLARESSDGVDSGADGADGADGAAGAASTQVPDPDADAVIVFTSGATGAAKPVAYSWARLAATAEVLRDAYAFEASDVLVAAFAPWSVMGPLVGLPSVIPQMDASRPGTLTADALGAAVAQAGGTVMWASPAAVRSVLASAPVGSAERAELRERTGSMRMLLIAGAPVSRALIGEVTACWPDVDVRTPYGMTEVLPATDVRAAEIVAAEARGGVLVGRPLPGVEIAVAELDERGEPGAHFSADPGVLGEVALRARHGKSRYDARAFTERHASRNPGWHRTGDVGRLDDQGRLRIEGRLAHVITTADGPLGPVSIEQALDEVLADEGLQAAAVGIGRSGAQVVAVVLAPATAKGRRSRLQLASPELLDRVRAIAPIAVAVLWRDAMPVDIRHGAKVDRAQLAKEADRLLAGRR